jgi:hypothetical protein
MPQKVIEHCYQVVTLQGYSEHCDNMVTLQGNKEHYKQVASLQRNREHCEQFFTLHRKQKETLLQTVRLFVSEIILYGNKLEGLYYRDIHETVRVIKVSDDLNDHHLLF